MTDDHITSEIYPQGISGFRDEQERCEAAEEAAERLLRERNELRRQLDSSVLEHVRELVNYNWQPEQRDYQIENPDYPDLQTAVFASDGTRIWHTFERLRIINDWLDDLGVR